MSGQPSSLQFAPDSHDADDDIAMRAQVKPKQAKKQRQRGRLPLTKESINPKTLKEFLAKPHDLIATTIMRFLPPSEFFGQLPLVCKNWWHLIQGMPEAKALLLPRALAESKLADALNKFIHEVQRYPLPSSTIEIIPTIFLRHPLLRIIELSSKAFLPLTVNISSHETLWNRLHIHARRSIRLVDELDQLFAFLKLQTTMQLAQKYKQSLAAKKQKSQQKKNLEKNQAEAKIPKAEGHAALTHVGKEALHYMQVINNLIFLDRIRQIAWKLLNAVAKAKKQGLQFNAEAFIQTALKEENCFPQLYPLSLPTPEAWAVLLSLKGPAAKILQVALQSLPQHLQVYVVNKLARNAIFKEHWFVDPIPPKNRGHAELTQDVATPEQIAMLSPDILGDYLRELIMMINAHHYELGNYKVRDDLVAKLGKLLYRSALDNPQLLKQFFKSKPKLLEAAWALGLPNCPALVLAKIAPEILLKKIRNEVRIRGNEIYYFHDAPLWDAFINLITKILHSPLILEHWSPEDLFAALSAINILYRRLGEKIPADMLPLIQAEFDMQENADKYPAHYIWFLKLFNTSRKHIHDCVTQAFAANPAKLFSDLPSPAANLDLFGTIMFCHQDLSPILEDVESEMKGSSAQAKSTQRITEEKMVLAFTRQMFAKDLDFHNACLQFLAQRAWATLNRIPEFALLICETKRRQWEAARDKPESWGLDADTFIRLAKLLMGAEHERFYLFLRKQVQTKFPHKFAIDDDSPFSIPVEPTAVSSQALKPAAAAPVPVSLGASTFTALAAEPQLSTSTRYP